MRLVNRFWTLLLALLASGGALLAPRPLEAGLIKTPLSFQFSSSEPTVTLVQEIKTDQPFDPFLAMSLSSRFREVQYESQIQASFPDMVIGTGVVNVGLNQGSLDLSAALLEIRGFINTRLRLTEPIFGTDFFLIDQNPFDNYQRRLSSAGLLPGVLGFLEPYRSVNSIDVPLLGSFGFNIAIDFFEQIAFHGISGDLTATHRETGTETSQSLTLTSTGELVGLDLTLPGLWDVSFENLELVHTHAERITGNAVLSVGGSVTFDFNEHLGPTQLPFQAFGSNLFQNWFSIEVQQAPQADVVPEPSSLALLALGAVALIASRRRRRAA